MSGTDTTDAEEAAMALVEALDLLLGADLGFGGEAGGRQMQDLGLGGIVGAAMAQRLDGARIGDRKSTRLNSSH